MATAETTTTTTTESTEETEIVTSEIGIVTSETETFQGPGKESPGTTEIVTRAPGIGIRLEATEETLLGREILSRKMQESDLEIPIKDRGPRLENSTTRNWTIDEPSRGSETPTIVGTPIKGNSFVNKNANVLPFDSWTTN